MKDIQVKDLMVPLGEYATVHENATLYDAVLALEKAQETFDQRRYRHRAVLVYDDRNEIVGKLSQLDVIRGLEPKYQDIVDSTRLAHSVFTPDYLRSMVRSYALWDKPLKDVCRKAAHIKVKDIMYTHLKEACVEEDAGLNEAINVLILGQHQSLLVTKQKKIVGVLRLTDVFHKVCSLMKECAV